MSGESSDLSARSSRESDREWPNDEPTSLRSHEPSPAASIKDYSLQAFLGEGSTAHVYLATRIEDHEPVAIKAIDKLLVRQAQMEHKVQREILLHSPLRHRHVVRVRDTFEDTRNHYIVLEYCPGGSVASLVRQMREKGEKMEETMAKSLFRQTALGVAYLHDRGIIHRDLKLSNLLLTEDGDVKISDFGLATLMSDDHATVCGTPNYIAPEVLSAGDSTTYDHTVDIWSLGCILYTLMLGKPPFEGQKVSETLANVTNAGLQPLHFPRGFSATAGDLIKRLLSRDAAARPKIAQVLAHPWLRSLTPTNSKRSTPVSVLESRSISQSQMRLSQSKSASKNPTKIASGSSRPLRGIQHQSRHRFEYESEESSAALDLSVLAVESSSDESGAGSSDLDDSRLESEEVFSSSLASAKCDTDQDLSLLGGEESNRPQNVAARESHIFDGKCSLGPSKLSGEVKSPAPEVHFLRMQIEVSDLQFLGIAPDTVREIIWDCWETADIRQLTRFTLRLGRGEIEYIPSSALIQGTHPSGYSVRHFCIPPSGPCERPSTVTDDMLQLVRLCQCLASRSLQLRRAAMAVDLDKLPIVHFERLPEFLLSSLRRESVRSTATYQLSNAPSQHVLMDGQGEHNDRVRCVVPGVGLGEFDNEGRLMIQFFSGTMLQMNAGGSKIRYRRSNSVDEDEFDLAVSPFLPTEVKKHFEHVPTFVRELQS